MIDDYYVVEASFDLDEYFMQRTEEVEALAGSTADETGAGFGCRDLTWYFPTLEQAQECATDIGNAGFDVAVWVGKVEE